MRLIVCLLSGLFLTMSASGITLTSPSNNLSANVNVQSDGIDCSVSFLGETIMQKAKMGIIVDECDYSQKSRMTGDVERYFVDETYPVLGVKSLAHRHR